MELYTRKRNPAQVQSRARAYKPRANGIANRVVPAKKKKIARKKTTQPSRNRCPCPQRKNPFQPKRNRAPRTCRQPKRNPAIAELRPAVNRRKKKTEEKIYRLRGRIFIVGLFGSGVASSVSSSSKSGINAFSRFSGAADFSAGCSASTRMARLPLL